MKRIPVMLAVELLAILCITLLCISCSKGRTARRETVEYRVLSSRLIKSHDFVILSENPVGGADTSPCSFKTHIQHDCETVLSGWTAVSRPEMNIIKSRIAVIQSSDGIPEGLKREIAKHLDVKLGKVFAGGGGVLVAGPKEFDDTKFRALFIVGIAAAVDEYEITYSSNPIGDDAAQGNGGERKATVSVYKNIAPFSKIRLYQKDNGKAAVDGNERADEKHVLDIKSYMRNETELMVLKAKYEKGTSDAEKRIAREISSAWKRIHAKGENPAGMALKIIVFKEDGSCELSVVASDGSMQKHNCTFEILSDKEQKKFPGRKPLILLSTKDALSVIPLVDVSVDYDSRFPTSYGTILKFHDLDGKEFFFAR